MDVEAGFRERVEAVVARIPRGRVMTYGQLAALAGNARAARVVGGIAHFGNPALPWQRVVNKQGGLAAGYPGGRSGHAQVLEAEGVAVSDDYFVDVERLIWWPEARPESPLLVIVGETASGKSALALDLAERFGGEIICADSTTVRRGVDIGSAKPTWEEQARVPHHLLDVVGPDERFTAAQFKQLAEQAISDISARGKLPIMVGGSGLYIDSVIYDYDFRQEADPALREELNSLNRQELLARTQEMGLELGDTDTRNERRLIRLIETGGQRPTKNEYRNSTLILGLNVARETLKERVAGRLDDMLAAGLEAEVRRLADRYGWRCEALKAVGYAQWEDYMEGSQTLAETRQQIIKATLDLAKRQRTWFKRNKSIHWFTTPVKQTEIVDLVTTFLSDGASLSNQTLLHS